MQIVNKQQTDIDISTIESSIATFINSINASIFALNSTHQALWSLPDDRLVNVLQKMLDSGTLMTIFMNHNYSASVLNEIQNKSNSTGPRAIDVAGREITIVDGIVSIKPISVDVQNLE